MSNQMHFRRGRQGFGLIRNLVVLLGLAISVLGSSNNFASARDLVETRREITYISFRNESADIWSLDLSSLTERRLTQTLCNEGRIDNYEWSPDGSLVAFVEVCPGQVQLKLLQVETGNTYIVSNNAESAIPAWHPDGTEIAFGTSAMQGRAGTVFIADVTNLDNITVEALDTELSCMGECLNVMWSSDGSLLAFYGPPLSSSVGAGSFRSNVSVYDLISGSLLQIGVYDVFPYGLSWSQEGQYLAIAAPSGRGAASFGLVDIQGEDQIVQYQQIRGADTDVSNSGELGAGFYYPHFSMDDSLIAVVSPSPTAEYPPDPVGGIYLFGIQEILSDDFPSFVTLVAPSENCAMPRWSLTSPDELIYVCGVGTASEIWLSNLSFNDRQQVTMNNFEELLPRWRPS